MSKNKLIELGDTISVIYNGIICKHDIPIKMMEENTNVLFLHNEKLPIGELIGRFSPGNKITVSYFVSDEHHTEDEIKTGALYDIYGIADSDISSNPRRFSSTTPGYFWDHENNFGIGGHDLQSQFRRYSGKWIYLKITRNQNDD